MDRRTRARRRKERGSFVSADKKTNGTKGDMRRRRSGLASPGFVLLAGLISLLGCQPQETDLIFRVSPDDHVVVEGLPVTLRCEAEPSGVVKYSWLVDGQPLAPSPRRHQRDGDLYISRADRMLDSGNFVCVATHQMDGTSIESSPAKVNVQWISEASVQLQLPKPAPSIRAGGKVELRCHVDGSGELKYEWFRNTRSIHPDERLEIKRHLLIIKEASPEDNGVYRCLARNSAGASSTAHSYALTVPSNETATARIIPQKVIARRGEPASFDCAFDNADSLQWHFEDKDDPIESDDARTVMKNGTLIVHKAKDSDKGFYSCRGIRAATTQVYAAELQIAYLKNLSAASFEPMLRDQLAVVAEGQELQVSCLAPGGLPTPKLFWRDPQGRIISDSGPVRVQDDTLIIAKARKGAHSGNYSCVAENLAGSTTMNVNVLVSWPAELRSSPRATSVREDEAAILSCTYRAMEPPVTSTRWLKDGEPLREQSTSGGATAKFQVDQQPGNSSLVIQAAQLTDRGSYLCEVTTQGFPPLRSQAASLTVREKLKFSPEPVNRRLELNSTAKVPCKATGYGSPPTFKWYKNGSEHLPKHVQEVNGTLHFSHVLEDDKGNYTCVAVNNQDRIDHTIKIDVVIAPKFSVRPENATASEGSSVVLHCAAEGDPKPTIQWDKDSRMNNLNDERFRKLENGSLYIQEVYLSDEGKYGCTAGNSGGFKREEAYLTVQPVEGYRTDMELDAAEDGSMMTKTVIITLGAAAAYMVLVIGLMLYCRYQRRRRKQRYLQEQGEQEKGEHELQEEECELKETVVKTNSSANKRRENRESHKSDGTDTAHSQNSNHSKRSKSSYDKLAVSRAHLQELKPLGRGEFGDIFSSKLKAPAAAGDETSTATTTPAKEPVVMVKTLNNAKDENVLQEFKRHLDLLHKLNHEHVAKLIGLCREEEPDYMIMEYTDWGDLKKFLIASKNKETNLKETEGAKPRAPQLTVAQILSLANQAARGLKHISDHRMVHKDIAARNCLISSNLTIKISLACMTKEPHQQEYTKHRNQVIPLRWMPKEAVFEDEYSTKSDVYSYSCLVWEMFYQGELPFKKLNDESVIGQLKSQTLTWTAHKAAPGALQELQSQCWSYDPRERPTFDQIVGKLQDIVSEFSQV